MPFVKPDFPGTKITIVGEAIASVPPSFAGVVAIPFTHDWGPVGSDSAANNGGMKLLTSFSEFERYYGTSDTPGRRAILQAFSGQGLPGQGGAGGVIAYRMAAAAGAFAARILNNSAAAPAITLTAVYKGDAGELITIVVGADPQNAANDRLRILFRGAEVQRFSYVKTNITDLAAQINANPQWVKASAVTSGTALAAVAGSALTAGDDGATLTAGEWTTAMNALEFENFSLFAPFNNTDPTIQAAILAWTQQMEAANRPVMTVIGGAAAETLATAITRSTTNADPHIVNLGVGTYHDDLLNRDLSTSEMAPRIAGILAARGEEKALTYAELGGLSVVGGTNAPLSSEYRTAINAGVTVIGRASGPDLRIIQGVTTFTSKVDPARPYDVFSEPRHVRIMDIFIRGMREWADDVVIGDLPVNADTRATVRGEARRRIDSLMARGLILTTVDGAVADPFVNTPIPNDPSLLDAVLFEFGWQFARTANYVIGQGRVR